MFFSAYVTDYDRDQLSRVTGYIELRAIAMGILERVPEFVPVAMVCGPICSGGSGDLLTNVANLRKTIAYVSERATYLVFDQTQFEECFDFDLPSEFFNEFYKVLFDRYITHIFFTHDSETSVGARKEMAYVINYKVRHTILGPLM